MVGHGYGYKIIYGGYVHHARTLDDAAGYLLAGREAKREVRFRVCESLTRDRQPTADEQAALIFAACDRIFAAQS